MPEAPTPDLLQINFSDHRDFLADKVDLWLTVKGSSLLTGKAAISKAKEVSKLVADLQQVGVGEADVEVLGVRAEVTSGMMSKSSSAIYSLRVRCLDLEKLADVLGAATAQKNVSVDKLEWGYPPLEESEMQCLESCLKRASLRAARMAASLGVEIRGIHQVSHTIKDEEAHPDSVRSYESGLGGGSMRRRGGGDMDLGMEVTHRKRVFYAVKVDYHIGGFKATPSA